MSKWYSFEELKRARTPMPLDSETGLPDNHVITVVERVISVDNSELIQNNVRTDTFTLNLDAEYDDLNVVVIFTKPNNINVKVAYNGTPTHIPGSAMELVGSLACSVVGIDADGEVRAVTKAAPDTFQVVESGAYDGSVTSDDAELLGQILQAVSDAETAITAAETATTAATNATSQATSTATSANQAASSANSTATDYEPPNITTTPIDLQGHTLNSLPDGTRDELHIDGGGNVVLEKRCGVATAPTVASEWTWRSIDSRGSFALPAISRNKGSWNQSRELLCDKLPPAMSIYNVSHAVTVGGLGYAKNPAITSTATAATVAGGATYIYPLAEPQTISLGTITPPTMAAPNVTAYVADGTPAEIELDYVRDINVVVDRLEKKVAGLAVMEATNV